MSSLPESHPEVQPKVCSKCAESKPTTDYYVVVKKTGCLFPWCKKCHNAINKANAAKHPERQKEYQKRDYQKHREKRIAAVKQWGKDNPEKLKARKQKHRERHPEVYVKANQIYYEKNRELIRERSKQWEVDNPEKYKAMCTARNNNRRAKVKEIGGTYTAQDWIAIKEFYKYACLLCGRKEPEIELTVDHVIPIDAGGSNDPENLAPLCLRCNQKKGSKVIPDYRLAIIPPELLPSKQVSAS